MDGFSGKAGAWSIGAFVAAYHVFTPWMIVIRTVGLLPLIVAVKRSNIYVEITVHVLIDSIDVVMGFAFISAMS